MTTLDRFAIFSQLLSRSRGNIVQKRSQESPGPILIDQCSDCNELQFIGEQAEQIEDHPCSACGSCSPILRYRLKIDALEPITRTVSKEGRRRLVKPISDERIIENFIRVPRSASPKNESWDEVETPTLPNDVRSPQHRDRRQPSRRKIIAEIAGSAIALGTAAAVCGGLMLGTLSGEKIGATKPKGTNAVAILDQTPKGSARKNFLSFASAESAQEKGQYISDAPLYREEISEWLMNEAPDLSLKQRVPQNAMAEEPIQDDITLLSITEPLGYPTHVYFTDDGIDWPSFIQSERKLFEKFLHDSNSKPTIFRLNITRSNHGSSSPFEVPFLAKDLQPDSGAQLELSGSLQIDVIREIIEIPSGASRIATLVLRWDHSADKRSIVLDDFIGWGLHNATASGQVLAATLPVN